MVRQTQKCIICEQRPARQAGICAQCGRHIEHECQVGVRIEPRYYLTYRDAVVGLYPNGGDVLKARLLKREASHLPKGKTIDLNGWCEGFDRSQIRKMKATVLQLSNA